MTTLKQNSQPLSRFAIHSFHGLQWASSLIWTLEFGACEIWLKSVRIDGLRPLQTATTCTLLSLRMPGLSTESALVVWPSRDHKFATVFLNFWKSRSSSWNSHNKAGIPVWEVAAPECEWNIWTSLEVVTYNRGGDAGSVVIKVMQLNWTAMKRDTASDNQTSKAGGQLVILTTKMKSPEKGKNNQK